MSSARRSRTAFVYSVRFSRWTIDAARVGIGGRRRLERGFERRRWRDRRCRDRAAGSPGGGISRVRSLRATRSQCPPSRARLARGRTPRVTSPAGLQSVVMAGDAVPIENGRRFRSGRPAGPGRAAPHWGGRVQIARAVTTTRHTQPTTRALGFSVTARTSPRETRKSEPKATRGKHPVSGIPGRGRPILRRCSRTRHRQPRLQRRESSGSTSRRALRSRRSTPGHSSTQLTQQPSYATTPRLRGEAPHGQSRFRAGVLARRSSRDGHAGVAQEAAKPDSPEVRQLLETAKKNAGTEWTEAFDFICALNAGRANSPDRSGDRAGQGLRQPLRRRANEHGGLGRHDVRRDRAHRLRLCAINSTRCCSRV